MVEVYFSMDDTEYRVLFIGIDFAICLIWLFLELLQIFFSFLCFKLKELQSFF